jgi:hypothetical protein
MRHATRVGLSCQRNLLAGDAIQPLVRERLLSDIVSDERC